jgi:hypothetical protein
MMRQFYFLCALGAIFCLFHAKAVYAAPQAQAMEKLRMMAERELKALQAEALAQGGRIETKGELLIVPEGDYYKITLPFMTSYSASGERLDLGQMKINIAVGQSADEWRASMALPSPMTFFDASGQKMGQMFLGAQKLSFIWREDLLIAPKVDAEFKNIRFVSEQIKDNLLVVDALKVQFDLAEDQKTKYWSGPYHAELRGITAHFAENNFKLGRLFTHGQYEAVDFAKLKRLKELALETQDKALQEKAIKDFMATMTVPFDGVKGEGGIEQMEISRSMPDGTVKKASLQSMVTSYSVDDMRSASGRAKTAFQFNGLVAGDFANKSLSPMIPEEGQFKLSLQDVPVALLLGFVKDAGLMMGDYVPKDNQKTAPVLKPMTLSITDSFLKAPKLTTRMNGLFEYQPDPAKTSLPKGAFTLSFQGLDDLIMALQADQSKEAQSAFVTLSTLRMMGQPSQENDKAISFTFKLDEAGNLTMNDAPIGGLIGGLLGAMSDVPWARKPSAETPSP